MYYIVCSESIVDRRQTCPSQDALQGWADKQGEQCYVIDGNEIDMVAMPRRRFRAGETVMATRDIPGIIIDGTTYGQLDVGDKGEVWRYTDDGRIAVDFRRMIHTFSPDTDSIQKIG